MKHIKIRQIRPVAKMQDERIKDDWDDDGIIDEITNKDMCRFLKVPAQMIGRPEDIPTASETRHMHDEQ